MSKPKKKTDVYQMITDRILEMLSQGKIPWRRTWKGGADMMPRNLSSNKAYRGINVFWLHCQGRTSPFWMTFKQAKTLGGSVKKGEKGTIVVFWKPIEREELVDGVMKKKGFLLLRYYTVFNLEQTEGVRIPKGRIQEELEEEVEPVEVSEHVEAAVSLFNRYVEREEIKVLYNGSKPCYVPTKDMIHLPVFENFEDGEAFCSVAFHEAGHSTGAEKRLNRPGIAKMDSFGSHQYAEEELVAEFASSFLCSMMEVNRNDDLENAAAYIQNWSRKLEKEPKLIVMAAQRAQKASDRILDEELCEDHTNE